MAAVDVSLSFNNNIISPNIADPFAITVTNNDQNGRSIKIFTCKLVVVHDSVEYQVGPEYAFMATNFIDYITVLSPRTLRNDQFRSYQANGTSSRNAYDCLNINSLRALQIKIRFEATYGDNSVYKSGAIDIPNVYAIDSIIGPQIENLSFARCDSSGTKDQFGTNLLTTLKINYSVPSRRNLFGLRILQKAENMQDNEIVIPANDTRMEDFYNGIVDSNMFLSSLIVGTYNKCNIIVTLTDRYESSVLSYSVPSSFVNVHLSAASTGGVAFGKLSSATNNNPLFECEYPTRINNSLDVYGAIGNIRGGIVTPIWVEATSAHDFTVTFDSAFSSVPFVTFSLCGSADFFSPAYYYGISSYIFNITESSFKVHVENYNQYRIRAGFSWIAYGQL